MDFQAIDATGGWFVHELRSAIVEMAQREGWLRDGHLRATVIEDRSRPDGSPLLRARHEVATVLDLSARPVALAGTELLPVQP